MGFNEELRAARVEYVDAAMAEMNAICNVIENDEVLKSDMIKQRAQQLGEVAQEAYWRFIQKAKEVNPSNKVLSELLDDSPDEN